MPSLDATIALLVEAGVLTAAEAAAVPPDFGRRVRRDPYALTHAFSELPPPALRWGWQPEQAATFCQWAEATLAQRFSVPLRVLAEPEGDPVMLRLQLDGREEVVDWAYLNSARWMGSFCTIVARLLLPKGVEAIELDTGDLDTVVLFCRSEFGDDLRDVMPVAE